MSGRRPRPTKKYNAFHFLSSLGLFILQRNRCAAPTACAVVSMDASHLSLNTYVRSSLRHSRKINVREVDVFNCIARQNKITKIERLFIFISSSTKYFDYSYNPKTLNPLALSNLNSLKYVDLYELIFRFRPLVLVCPRQSI